MKNAKTDLSYAELLRALSYDPESGIFRWKIKRNSYGGGVRPGDRAGAVRCNKESSWREIGINGVRYKEHRLAWLYSNEAWPSEEIDHINRNPLDNRLDNLREATRSQNQANALRPQRCRPKSGYKGVYRGKSGRWFSHVSVDGILIRLGRFDSPAEAHETYKAKIRELRGDFAVLSYDP